MVPITLSIFIVGIIVFTALLVPVIFERCLKTDKESAGNLIVAIDPEDGPYVFLEMHMDVDEMLKQKTILLKVVKSDPRK